MSQAALVAIASSVAQNRIVTIDYDAAAAEELSRACEDSVEAYGLTEYWGTDDDGDTWRVHMRDEADINAVVKALSGIVEIKIDGDDRAHVTNHAPDSSDPEYDGDTAPGSAWDEECDARLAAIRESLPSGWSAEWSDDDVIIEREVVS